LHRFSGYAAGALREHRHFRNQFGNPEFGSVGLGDDERRRRSRYPAAAHPRSNPMFRKPTLKMNLQQLGLQVLDDEALKAVMISKDEAGDIVITLVEGIEESHKVKFGRIDRRSRTLIPHSPERRNGRDAQIVSH
jgi:hypothetical protein